MALAGHKALVKAQSSAIAFTDEATTTSDNQTYIITDTAKRIWDLNTAIVVEDAGVPTTESYTLNRLTGEVVFVTVDAGRVITVTGAYVVLTTVAESKSFTFSGSRDSLDITAFQDEYREYVSGLLTGTADLGRNYETDVVLSDLLFDGVVKVIEYYPVSTGDPIRFYGLATANAVDAAAETIVEESLSFQITNELQFI